VNPEGNSTRARLGDCVPEGTSAAGDDRNLEGIPTGARPTDRVPERASAGARPSKCVLEGILTACRAISGWPSMCPLVGLAVPDGRGLAAGDGLAQRCRAETVVAPIGKFPLKAGRSGDLLSGATVALDPPDPPVQELLCTKSGSQQRGDVSAKEASERCGDLLSEGTVALDPPDPRVYELLRTKSGSQQHGDVSLKKASERCGDLLSRGTVALDPLAPPV